MLCIRKRPFSGVDQIQAARDARDRARTADELPVALAALLSLEAGLNLEKTAQKIHSNKR